MQPSGAVGTTKFVILDFGRFIFAALVSFSHFTGAKYPPMAYLGVDFFFVLSGFVLTHAYIRRSNDTDFLENFLIDRISRLYPLFFATTTILVFFNIYFHIATKSYLEQGWSYQDGYFYTLVLNLLLLHNIGLTTGPSWNAPGWSISVEFFGSLFLALLLLQCIGQVRKSVIFAALVSLTCFIIIFNNVHSLGPFSKNIYGLLNSGLLRGVAGIFLGFLAYQTYLHYMKAEAKVWQGTILVLASAGSFLLIMGCVFFGNRFTNADFCSLPFTFTFVLSTALIENRLLGDRKADSSIFSLMEKLGSISYSIYLIHWPALTFCRYILFYGLKVDIDFYSRAFALIFFPVIGGLSMMTHYWYEIPAKKFLRRRLRSPLVSA